MRRRKTIFLGLTIALGTANMAHAQVKLVEDINPGSDNGINNCEKIILGNDLYFQGRDNIYGDELWKVDGATGVAGLAADIDPGSSGSDPSEFFIFGADLYFSADDGSTGKELWKLDGTTGITSIVEDINPGPDGSYARDFAVLNSDLYFRADDGTTGYELWKVDGASGLASLVQDINPLAPNSYPSSLTVLGSDLYFYANDGTNGIELHKMDGTSGIISLVADINPVIGASSDPNDLIVLGIDLYFTANDGVIGKELWKVDGTSGAASLVQDINTSGWSNPEYLTVIGVDLYFSADDGTVGRELWKVDGVSGNVSLLQDINTTGNSHPYDFTLFDGDIYFNANDGINGGELWKVDGVSGAVSLAFDIVPGINGAGPNGFIVYDNDMYFQANDGVNGYELFKLDDESNTVSLVYDINPNGYASPECFIVFGNDLYFTAEEDVYGRELWKLCTSHFNQYPQPGSGYALSLDGLDDDLTISDNNSLDVTDNFTISTWLKNTEGTSLNYDGIFWKKPGSNYTDATGWFVEASGNNSIVMYGAGATEASWNVDDFAIDGEWHHMAIIVENDSARLFWNGMDMGNKEIGLIVANNEPLIIGYDPQSSDRHWKGYIDEVQLWSGSLTESTIRNWMCKKMTSDHPNLCDIRAYYRFDENDGSLAINDLALNNNGLLGNGATWALSGAPIGDVSSHSYGNGNSATLTQSYPDGSNLTISDLSGTPDGVHLYFVDGTANSVVSNLSGSLDDSRYYGSFIVGGTASTHSLNYDYANNSNLNGISTESEARLSSRVDNSVASWTMISDAFDQDRVGNTITKCNLSSRAEIMAGFDNSTDNIIAVSNCGPINFGGNSFASDTIVDYVYAGGKVNGCDSVVRVDLTILNATSYSFSVTNCKSYTSPSGNYTWTNSNTYNDTIINAAGCDSVLTITVTINNANNAVTVANETITATATVGASYQWLDCDNLLAPIIGETNQVFNATSNGNYAVEIIENGCTDTSSCQIINSAGISNELNNSTLSVYPNPTNSKVTIDFGLEVSNAQLSVYNLLGEIVQQYNIQDKETFNFQIQGEKGIYLLKLLTDSGKLTTVSVVKN